MAGMYVHIPFCKKACTYCNFHFSTSFQMKDELINAIVSEIELQREYLGGQEVSTIYFGGGTPSAIPADDIRKIIEVIRQNYFVAPNAEITLEANPDDIRSGTLKSWKETGINRLSIGIQAFQENLLRAWNRSHTSDQAKAAIQLSQNAGFENITADLIYGGPGLSDEDWIKNINTLIRSGIPHISSYALTVEKGTALSHQIDTGKVIAPDDEQGNRQYSILQSILKVNGFEQYEVSNFSLPGMNSRHNTSYWSGKHYLGIGPSAHSYDGISRQWNVANNIKYIQSIKEKLIPFEKEILTEIQRYNELVMTGLRTSNGIDNRRVSEIGEKFAFYLDEECIKREGKIIKNELGNWMLKPEYYFFADGIAADLFFAP
ncbi:MAG: radical SAM family heme chaperone HemW [Saprospiraceae bacterium]